MDSQPAYHTPANIFNINLIRSKKKTYLHFVCLLGSREIQNQIKLTILREASNSSLWIFLIQVPFPSLDASGAMARILYNLKARISFSVAKYKQPIKLSFGTRLLVNKKKGKKVVNNH